MQLLLFAVLSIFGCGVVGYLRGKSSGLQLEGLKYSMLSIFGLPMGLVYGISGILWGTSVLLIVALGLLEKLINERAETETQDRETERRRDARLKAEAIAAAERAANTDT